MCFIVSICPKPQTPNPKWVALLNSKGSKFKFNTTERVPVFHYLCGQDEARELGDVHASPEVHGVTAEVRDSSSGCGAGKQRERAPTGTRGRPGQILGGRKKSSKQGERAGPGVGFAGAVFREEGREPPGPGSPQNSLRCPVFSST